MTVRLYDRNRWAMAAVVVVCQLNGHNEVRIVIILFAINNLSWFLWKRKLLILIYWFHNFRKILLRRRIYIWCQNLCSKYGLIKPWNLTIVVYWSISREAKPSFIKCLDSNTRGVMCYTGRILFMIQTTLLLYSCSHQYELSSWSDDNSPCFSSF